MKSILSIFIFITTLILSFGLYFLIGTIRTQCNIDCSRLRSRLEASNTEASDYLNNIELQKTCPINGLNIIPSKVGCVVHKNDILTIIYRILFLIIPIAFPLLLTFWINKKIQINNLSH